MMREVKVNLIVQLRGNKVGVDLPQAVVEAQTPRSLIPKARPVR
jgi:hypothetical protein